MFHWQPIRRVCLCNVCAVRCGIEHEHWHESARRTREWQMNETQPACVHSMLRAQHYHIVSCRLVSTRLVSVQCHANLFIFFLRSFRCSLHFFFIAISSTKLIAGKKCIDGRKGDQIEWAIAAAVLCET